MRLSWHQGSVALLQMLHSKTQRQPQGWLTQSEVCPRPRAFPRIRGLPHSPPAAAGRRSAGGFSASPVPSAPAVGPGPGQSPPWPPRGPAGILVASALCQREGEPTLMLTVGSWVKTTGVERCLLICWVGDGPGLLTPGPLTTTLLKDPPSLCP